MTGHLRGVGVEAGVGRGAQTTLSLFWLFLGLAADVRNMGLMPTLSSASLKQVALGPSASLTQDTSGMSPISSDFPLVKIQCPQMEGTSLHKRLGQTCRNLDER